MGGPSPITATSRGQDNSVVRSLTSGPKFFPSDWCGSSSIDDRSSCHDELALPGLDDSAEDVPPPEEAHGDSSVLEDDGNATHSDSDAEGDKETPGSPEPLEDEVAEESHDVEPEVKEDGEGKARRI